MAETAQITRQCRTCGAVLPVSAFSGYNRRCNQCRAQEERERRARAKANNPDIYKSEHKRTRDREYREKNAEKLRYRRKELYQGDPERHREYVRAYRKRHPDRIKESNARPEAVAARKDYIARHPELGAVYARNYRARKRSAGGEHSWDDILSKMESQGGLCVWCGRPYGDNYEIDHVVPVSRGGSNAPANIAVACFECNRIKNAKMPPAWPGGNYH
jgi:5-methylcytosine-specific restriction endonuclease McrA